MEETRGRSGLHSRGRPVVALLTASDAPAAGEARRPAVTLRLFGQNSCRSMPAPSSLQAWEASYSLVAGQSAAFRPEARNAGGRPRQLQCEWVGGVADPDDIPRDPCIVGVRSQRRCRPFRLEGVLRLRLHARRAERIPRRSAHRGCVRVRDAIEGVPDLAGVAGTPASGSRDG